MITAFLVKTNFTKGLCARPPSPSFPILSFWGLWSLVVSTGSGSPQFQPGIFFGQFDGQCQPLSGIAAFCFLGPFGPLEPVRFCGAVFIAFIPRRSFKLKFVEEVMPLVERGALSNAGIGLSFLDGCEVSPSSESDSEVKVNLASSFLSSSSSLLSLVVSPPSLFSCLSLLLPEICLGIQHPDPIPVP